MSFPKTLSRRLFPVFLGIMLFPFLWSLTDHRSRSGFPGDLDTDEPQWVAYSSLTFQLYVRERKIFHEIWLLPHLHTGMNPCAGKLILGGALHLFGVEGGWNPGIYFIDNQAKFKIEIEKLLKTGSSSTFPSLSALAAARKVLGAFHLGICLLMAIWISGFCRISALFAFFGFFFHPLFVFHGSKALLDLIGLFFAIAGTMLFSRTLTRNAALSSPAKSLFMVLSGAFLALATGTKLREFLSPLFILGVVFLAIHRKESKIDPPPEGKEFLPTLGIWLIAFFAVFLLTNPGLFSDPLRTLALYWNLGAFQAGEMRSAMPELALVSLQGLIKAAYEILFREFSFTRFSDVLEIPLVIMGFLLCLRHAWKTGATTRDPQNILFAWILWNVLGNGLWIPLKFPRYFLPFALASIFLESIAIGWLFSRASAKTDGLIPGGGD